MERLTRWVWEANEHSVIVLVYGTYFRLVKDDMNFETGLEIDLVDSKTRERVRNQKELADYVHRKCKIYPAHEDNIQFDFENAVWKQIRRQQ